MIFYEGSTFILFLITGGIFAGWVYFQDLKKSKSIQAFFSSMTHELKTPLASMRLQAEVIEEIIEGDKNSNPKLTKLISRLLEDNQKLETQMDKALQLAKLEQGASLTLTKINLLDFLQEKTKKYTEHFSFDFNIPENFFVYADHFALELIFKNFIENTKRHQKQSHQISISLSQSPPFTITYDDHGKAFNGDLNKLGELFYKHNSTQGTGVGLYLSKRLAKAMEGSLEIKSIPQLIFNLSLEGEFI